MSKIDVACNLTAALLIVMSSNIKVLFFCSAPRHQGDKPCLSESSQTLPGFPSDTSSAKMRTSL